MPENNIEREVSVDEAWDRLLPIEYPEKEALENLKGELNNVTREYLERLKEGEVINGVDFLKEFLDTQKENLQEKIDEVISSDKNEEDKVKFLKQVCHFRFQMANRVFSAYWLERMQEDDRVNPNLKESLDKHISKAGEGELDFNEVYNIIKGYLAEEYGNSDLEQANKIFEECWQDIERNNDLRELVEYVGGPNNEKMTPDVGDLWRKSAEDFFTPEMQKATQIFYPDGFIGKIFKCAGETQKWHGDNIANFIKSRGNEELVMYDNATGTGTIVNQVKERVDDKSNVQYLSSDVSSAMLNQAKDTVNGVVVRATMEEQPIASDSVDIFSQNLGGHHLTEEAQMKMLREALRVTKKGGLVSLGDVCQNELKVLAGLSNDTFAPERSIDFQNLDLKELTFDTGKKNDQGEKIYKVLKPYNKDSWSYFPSINKEEGGKTGIYSCAAYTVEEVLESE